MTNEKADISGAVAALSSVVKSLEQRSASLESAIQVARLERGRKLEHKVADLLPNISNWTFERLKKEAYSFASNRKVRDAFESNGKIFWLIKRPGYDRALTLLRTQLKSFLESTQFVAEEDARLARLETDRVTIASQQKHAMEMLDLMQRAHLSSRPVPREATQSINAIAQRGRILSRSGGGGAATSPRTRNGAASSSDRTSDDDLWLWMMTDIPTSFRTLMLNQVTVHHGTGGGGAFSGAGAQGAWSSDQAAAPSQASTPTQSDQSSQQANTGAGLVAGFVAGQMIDGDRFSAAAPAPPAPDATPAEGNHPQTGADGQLQWPAQSDPAIATDDSLGKFS